MRATALLAAARAQLAASGVPSPSVDAELLLAHVLHVPRGRLALADDASNEQIAKFGELLRRRIEREPLQHILGWAPFGALELHVGAGVFVPRPETELLAAWAAQQTQRGAVVVDLCSGSGALGLYLAQCAEPATVVLVENDSAALPYLRTNAAQPRAGTQVEVVAQDVTTPGLPDELVTRFGAADVVVCNPPYVPTDTVLDAEAAADPAVAVFSGADGLDLITRLAPICAKLLCGGGVVGLEHDDSNGEGAAGALRAAGFVGVQQHRDLAGRPRFVTGRMDA